MATGEQLKIVEKLRVMTDGELIDYYKVAMAYSVQIGPESPKWDTTHEILHFVREERKRRGITESVYGVTAQPVPVATQVASAETKKKKKKKGVGIFILVVLLLLVGMTAAAFITGMVTVEDVQTFIAQMLPEQEEKRENDSSVALQTPVVEQRSEEALLAEYACRKITDHLYSVLKNPNGMIVNQVSAAECEYGLAVKFDYSGENSFGGHVRDELYIIVNKSGSSYSITTLGDREFTGSSNQSYSKQIFEEAAALGTTEFDYDWLMQ